MDDLPLRRTYASALSDAFNNNNPQSNSGHCQNSNQEDWVICLLCRAAVLLNYAASSSQGNLMKRSRMLKNLCHHMQISSADIPPKCSTTSHPLCKNCEDQMSNLWRLQRRLHNVGLEISKIVKRVEKFVIDDNVINSGPQLQQSAFKRVTILKEKIMEGYRKKLLQNPPNSNGNPPVGFRVNKVEVNQEAVTHGPLTPSSSRRIGDDDDDDEESEVVEVHSDVMYEACGSQQSQEEIVIIASDDENPNDDEESMHFEEPQDMEEVVDHDEDIANVFGAEAEGQGRGAIIATASSYQRVQIQQEIVENQLLEANDEYDVDDYFVGNDPLAVKLCEEGRDRNMGSVGFTQVNQGSLMVLVEQEEYVADYNEDEWNQDDVVAPANVCVTPSPLQGKKQLQCHICSHTIIILNNSKSAHEASASQMRMHIRSAHKNEVLKRKKEPTRTKRQHQPKRSNLTCSRCKVTFDTKESLTEHKNTQHIIHCKICKRPFLPHQKYSLPRHLFSHKNQEERNAACKAGERGARAGNLAKRKWGKNPRAPRSPRSLTCSICSRTFARVNYLNMHMKTHKNRKETCSLAAAADEPQQHDLIALPHGLKQGIRIKFCKVMGLVPPNGN